MKKRSILLVTAAMLTSMVISACGSSSAAGSYSAKSNSDSYAAEESALYEPESYKGADYDSPGYGESADEESYDDSDVIAEGEENQSEIEMDPDASSGSTGENIKLRRDKLVYNATISIKTKKFDDTVSGCRELADKCGAIVESEDFNDSDTSWYLTEDTYSRKSYSRTLTINLRVPSGNFDSFVNSAGNLEGVVTSKNSNVTNISTQYYDAQEQMKAYKLELDRLYALMEKATEMDDILTIESRITEVQTNYNQIKSRISSMDTDVAYSYVTMYINEAAPSAVISTDDPTFGERLSDAFRSSISGFIRFLQGILLILARTWTFLLFLIIVILVIVRIIISADRRSKKKQMEREQFLNMSIKIPENVPAPNHNPAPSKPAGMPEEPRSEDNKH